MSDYESSVHLESALSVAHDLVDTVIRLKADSKLLGDKVESISSNLNSMLPERERQIQALIDECAKRDETLKEISTDRNTLLLRSDSFERQLRDKQSEIEALQVTIRSLKTHIDSGTNEAVRQYEELKKEMDNLNVSHREAIALQTQTIIDKNNEIAELNKKLSSVTAIRKKR